MRRFQNSPDQNSHPSIRSDRPFAIDTSHFFRVPCVTAMLPKEASTVAVLPTHAQMAQQAQTSGSGYSGSHPTLSTRI